MRLKAGGLALTRFIVEAVAGERLPFQRGCHHGWLPAQQWQKYLEANGPARCPTSSRIERASVSCGSPLGLFWDFRLHQPARA
jgi:hypothetical protein